MVEDATQAAVLRVQHDSTVSTHHPRCPTRLLHPQRLRWEGDVTVAMVTRWEGDDGNHYAAVDDRFSDAGCWKHAGHVGRPAARRYVNLSNNTSTPLDLSVLRSDHK